MSIEIVKGNILDSDAEYIAHQCNCLTNTSSGAAKAIFEKYPHSDIYKDRPFNLSYLSVKPKFKAGNIVVCGNDGLGNRPVINMLAQIFPGKPKFPDSDMDGYEKRLKYFRSCLDQISKIEGIKSVDFPHLIGCGLAGGDWNEYLKALEEFATNNKNIKVRLIDFN